MKDSGKRIVYKTGCIREPNGDKPRYDLITPWGLLRLAVWYTLGSKKYAPRNWEKGMPWSHCLRAAMGHLEKWRMGMTDEDHLAAAAWNIFALMHYEKCNPECNDVPSRGGK